MNKIGAYAVQGIVYAAIAAMIGYFANAPRYSRVPDDYALIKLSFAHGAVKKGECRRLTPEELARLAPNMRKPFVCPRERLPVVAELDVNGETLFSAVLPPIGLRGDGPSRAYERFVVPPGTHRIVARLRDTDRSEGFDHVTEREVVLAAGQSLAIDFDATQSGFKFE
ncbi:MAG: hypothetical protein ACFCUO_08480 [Rhodospirillales bacterium]